MELCLLRVVSGCHHRPHAIAWSVCRENDGAKALGPKNPMATRRRPPVPMRDECSATKAFVSTSGLARVLGPAGVVGDHGRQLLLSTLSSHDPGAAASHRRDCFRTQPATREPTRRAFANCELRTAKALESPKAGPRQGPAFFGFAYASSEPRRWHLLPVPATGSSLIKSAGMARGCFIKGVCPGVGEGFWDGSELCGC
jgi:hypothetical protein